MNKEEFIGKLQIVYVGDKNAFNEIVEDNQKLKNEVVYAKTEIDRLNNNLKELSDFAIKIYKKELDKTSDWWLQEELKTSFDDINLSTNFRLEEALKENNNV